VSDQTKVREENVCEKSGETNLGETDLVGTLTEALTADVDTYIERVR